MSTSTATATHGGSALTSLKRHWLTAVLVTVLATLLGIGMALTRPTTYTGETRLAIGKGEMSALNIPGYPTAAKDMAANYSRWVTSQGVAGIKPPDGVTSLTASPIPEAAVIRIEAKATDPDVALKGSQMAADALMNEVNKVREDNDPQKIMDDIVAHAPELSKAQAGAAGTLAKYNRDLAANAAPAVIEADLTAYSQTDTERAKLQVQQDARLQKYQRIVSTQSTEADLRPIGQGAQLAANDRGATIQRGALLGFGIGAIASLLLSVWLDRRGRGARA